MFRGGIPPAFSHVGPVVAVCLDLGVTARFIPVREPWRRVHEAILGLLANMTIWQMSQPVPEAGHEHEPSTAQHQPLSQLLSL